MVRIKTYRVLLFAFLFVSCSGNSQKQLTGTEQIKQDFVRPPDSVRPWVFWYWMHGAVSKEGITADLEAMKQAGIRGAYLMPIRDTSTAIPFQPQVRQLTAGWWEMVHFAMQEAKRLELQLAMHVSDGFALAGGPWITPELSMQKLVWTKKFIYGEAEDIILEQPETVAGYYRDIAVFAYRVNYTNDFEKGKRKPVVTASTNADASFLADEKGQGTFRSDSSCWITYAYDEPVSIRQLRIRKQNNAYQSQRLTISISADGDTFIDVDTLVPPRHGWQDWDEDYTYSIKPLRTRYIRFSWSAEGTEPGSEDLDAAKWKPGLRVKGIYPGDEPVINNIEAKNGSVWRIAVNTSPQSVPLKDAVPLKGLMNLTSRMDKEGKLHWKAPEGDWVILRIGHTSTGHTNETAGGGKGLECDKFSKTAVSLQFENWFGKVFAETDPGLANEVLKIFHVDSWECGSQNWSVTFREEFNRRRGYDLLPYLPVMTGVPVESAEVAEKVLHDVRETIAELVNDVFYSTLRELAHQKGCRFSAESVAPTMVSDGLLHYQNVDIPMGEFWFSSPTHDKPNDMLDAISGAHVYGKNIIQAESFTTLRMDWSENPADLKVVGDRNFALGINKMVIHVFTHNPWTDRKPGMTLGPIGLYYQRDQTWFTQSRAWTDYLSRCQVMLQKGKPVTDIAVFTGEEVPRRSLLPDRLVGTLPGIFGVAKVQAERKRLLNERQPLRKIPFDVTQSANMADPEQWIDPLNGYSYDSFNPDALMQMSVKNGRVVLPGGASYKILVIPGYRYMQPNSNLMSWRVAEKLLQLVKDGATIISSHDFQKGIGMGDNDGAVKKLLKELYDRRDKKGRIIQVPYTDSSFTKLGVDRDVDIINNDHTVAWTHRKQDNLDIYFISNQKNEKQNLRISFRIDDRKPELWDPVDGAIIPCDWEIKNGRIYTAIGLAPSQSLFVVFEKPAVSTPSVRKGVRVLNQKIIHPWELEFDPKLGGPSNPVIFDTLQSWDQRSEESIKYYSGTVVYKNSFELEIKDPVKQARIELDSVYNMATVRINGKKCGTVWTAPYNLDITAALQQGKNFIEIEVSNTWHNRLIGDSFLPEGKRVTWTTAPFRLQNQPLLPAGLIGEVRIIIR